MTTLDSNNNTGTEISLLSSSFLCHCLLTSIYALEQEELCKGLGTPSARGFSSVTGAIAGISRAGCSVWQYARRRSTTTPQSPKAVFRLKTGILGSRKWRAGICGGEVNSLEGLGVLEQCPQMHPSVHPLQLWHAWPFRKEGLLLPLFLFLWFPRLEGT